MNISLLYMGNFRILQISEKIEFLKLGGVILSP